jgi:hypothetical protein
MGSQCCEAASGTGPLDARVRCGRIAEIRIVDRPGRYKQIELGGQRLVLGRPGCHAGIRPAGNRAVGYEPLPSNREGEG